MSKTDIEISHITKPGANLFKELGFSSKEAKRYQTELQKQIEDTRAIKEQLMGELEFWIQDNHLKQEEAAKILHITRPRVSDVVNKRTNKFTIDALVNMLTYAGKEVRLIVC